MLLRRSLISCAEYVRIMAENRCRFPPVFISNSLKYNLLLSRVRGNMSRTGRRDLIEGSNKNRAFKGRKTKEV